MEHKLDTQTVLEIIKMIENQQADTTALFEGTREPELRDSDWVFKNEFVHYGAHKALDLLCWYLQGYIEEQLNAEELKTGE